MSVLVTGGAGYIGSHTTLLLLENGYDVITLDNLSNSTNESLKRVERLTNKKIKQYTGDISNSELLNRIFGENNITDVIHFAGLKSVSESINDPIKYYKNNVVGSLTLVSEMVKHKVTNIIFSSSATVYGQPEIIPLTEDCKTEKPTNPYGYSKLVVENILRDLVKSSHDFNVTCLRYFNPVGAHPSGEIGENPNGVPSNIMPYISGVAIGKYKQLNIYGSDYNTPDGTGIRDYIHVMDLAEGHLCALRKKWSTPSFRIYNLGTGKGYSVLELVNTFEQVSGIKIACNYSERRCGDIGECWSNPKAAERDLGWKAKYDIQKMVFDTWNWQQKNPTGYV